MSGQDYGERLKANLKSALQVSGKGRVGGPAWVQYCLQPRVRIPRHPFLAVSLHVHMLALAHVCAPSINQGATSEKGSGQFLLSASFLFQLHASHLTPLLRVGTRGGFRVSVCPGPEFLLAGLSVLPLAGWASSESHTPAFTKTLPKDAFPGATRCRDCHHLSRSQ